MKVSGLQTRRWARWSAPWLVLLALVLGGCGGGSSDAATDATAAEEASLAVSLTDAPGDFASYTVDVVGLTLTRANGAEVSTLPLTTRIDFAQYTDMTEFLSVATVPAGVYTAATLTLDYGNADIWVEDESGNLVQVQTVLDENGQAVSTLTVSVQLEGRNRLLIVPGVPAHLMLDFNLSATHQVTFEAGGPQVVVDPVLVADVDAVSEPKIHRLRGLLDEVSTAESRFTVLLRPFYCALTGSHGRFGRMTVLTAEETVYELDGATYTGAQGLAAMQGLDPLTAIVVEGDLLFDPLRFAARQVYAGSSVAWGTSDAVTGNVVARQDDAITVKGATLARADGRVIFHEEVTVQLGAGTTVSKPFTQETLTIDAVSVGQRLTVFGTLAEDDSAGLSLDATAGHVCLHITTVRGTVAAVGEVDGAARLTAALQSINHVRIGEFDFGGTGLDAAQDAAPQNYEIATGAIDLSALSVGTPVKVCGFVSDFGTAPPDFNALTVINVSDVRAFLKITWNPPTDGAFASVAADGLLVNTDGSGAFHHLFRGWVLSDVEDLPQPLAIVPRADATGLFVLRGDGRLELFLKFDDFADALAERLADQQVHKISATGRYDDAEGTLIADWIEVHLM
jgi:hypothetical protein